MNHLTTSNAVINDPINPKLNSIISSELKLNSDFIKSSPVAAAIVGIAKRNENSTAVFLFKPTNKPPIIVAAAREVPGIIENDCAIPISRDCFMVSFSMESIDGFPLSRE